MLDSHLRSIIAAEELNFCVRDENRCFLLAMGTEEEGLKYLTYTRVMNQNLFLRCPVLYGIELLIERYLLKSTNY